MNSKKPTESAMKNPINRSALLGRASTLTVAAAAAATASMFGAASAQADCYVTGGPLPSVNLSNPEECVVIDDLITGNVIVNTEVQPGNSSATFVVTDIIGGRLQNNGIISNTGGESSGIALLVYGGAIDGGITNTGRISSDTDVAISLSYGAIVGGIENTGEISGYHGIDGTEGFVIGGDIVNDEDAVIHGDQVGIRIVEDNWAFYETSLDGNISNRGTIEGGSAAILISTDSTFSSIFNDSSGVIQATDDSKDTAIAIHIESYDAYMDLNNSGRIEGIDGGFLFSGENFYGDISNRGEITSQGSIGAVRIGSTQTLLKDFPTNSVSGSLTNSGLIDGGEGWGVVIEAGEIGQPGTILSVAAEPNEVGLLDIFDETFSIVNRGEILGGVRLAAFEASVDVINQRDGVISSVDGGPGTGLVLSAFHMIAEVQNDGRIEGSSIGMAVSCDPVFGCKNPDEFFSNEVSPLVSFESSSFLYSSVTNRGAADRSTRGKQFVRCRGY